ncbi:NtaA/DmoA family FMN-dependent monooxygenase [Promicromonospora sukumoe]|uniref:NtaA/DmoA family FMN-dependent monooxygenase n=1 Tax=Promicromonospora sukumoe TaxID=88382 RepID=UPI00365FAD11
MSAPRRLSLGLGLYPIDDWRAEGAGPHDGLDLATYVEVAKIAEAAKFDALFRADSPNFDRNRAVDARAASPEPLIQLAAVASATSRIGLVATLSSTFNLPYNLARQLSTLDHLSGGRAGWNLVTSAFGEQNFGIELPPQELRYERAAEFVDVLDALFGSWDADAVVFDQAAGRYADPERIHDVEHAGRYFTVHDALGLPRSPQGRPVQFQAGASESGRAFAARYAEAIYSASPDLEHAVGFAQDVRARIAAAGRDPGLVKILPGAMITLGATHEEAVRNHRAAFTEEAIERGRRTLSSQFGGIDLTGLDLDSPIPHDRLPDPSTLLRRQSRPALFRDLALRPGTTLRDVIEHHLKGNGHWVLIGTPEEVAAELIEWHTAGAADGFNVHPRGRESLQLFIDGVLPILRGKGLFREEYEGTTLRRHLGLPVPD